MKATRVLIVTNMPSTHNTELFDRLSEQESIDLHVIYLTRSTVGRSWKTLAPMNHPHTLLQQWPREKAIYWSRGSLGLAHAKNPDIVIVNQYANLPMQAVAAALRRRGTKIVAWLEPPGVKFSEAPPTKIESIRVAGRSAATGLLRRNSDELWSITEAGKSLYQEPKSWKASRVMPYFGGIPVALNRRRSIPEQFSPDRPLRVLYAGKMIRRKGVDLLTSAVSELLDCDETHLTARFIGNGPLLGDVRETFVERAEVAVLPQVERHEMPRHYAWADVCVMPSRYDGWGMVAIEAAAAGCAIVATTTSGSATDRLAPSNACLLVPAQSTELIAAIRTLHDDVGLLTSLASASSNAAQHLTAEVGALNFARAIEELRG